MTRPRRLSVVGEARERAGEGRLTSRRTAPQPRAETHYGARPGVMALTLGVMAPPVRATSLHRGRVLAPSYGAWAELWRSSGAVMTPAP